MNIVTNNKALWLAFVLYLKSDYIGLFLLSIVVATGVMIY